MNLSEPTQIVTPTLDGPVLTALARATTPLTGSEVHRLARRGSDDGVRRALHRLAAEGIVEARRQGHSHVYLLNRHHLGADAVAELATLTTRLIDSIRDDIERWTIPPLHASLFGSLVRGEADETSDIDIFFVRPPQVDEMDEQWNRQLGILKSSVWSRSGNELQIIERSRSELHAERATPFFESLRNEAQHLFGDRLEQLLAPEHA